MPSAISVSSYHLSLTKRLFDVCGALVLLIFLLPLLLFIALLILLNSGLPIMFIQKRMGLNKQTFEIYKFRTMVRKAESLKNKYAHLNEASPPLYKIYNDPRFTGIGQLLAHTGLDELPQLINVLKGEMSLVGPRPLPLEEAEKLPQNFAQRHLIKPGMTSSWIVQGAHDLTFNQWQKLDLAYLSHGSLNNDVAIVFQTIKVIISMSVNKFLKRSGN